MDKNIRLKIFIALTLILIVIDVGGYMLIEGVNILDAVYMTFISVTTVGFLEVFPLSQTGRIFTIFVILSGIGLFFSLGVAIAHSIFEKRLRAILGRREMRALTKMKDHIIITGFGQMSKLVAAELHEQKIPFIIIEHQQECFASAEELGYFTLLANATDEDLLQKVGVLKARTFLALLPSDAENLFAVMTVRDLNPDIQIIARSTEPSNEKRLERAGADLVISPHTLSSRRIVNSVLKPNVVNLIDLVTQSKELSLSVEEITVDEDSPLVGIAIRDSGLRKDYNAMVVGVKRKEHLFYNPDADLILVPGDILILIGEKDKITRIG
jgi:voltage-gated potassium channel